VPLPLERKLVAFRKRRVVLAVECALGALCGCSIAAGATYPYRTGQSGVYPGVAVAARAQLPTEYAMVLGLDWATRSRWGPFDVDQWRLAGYVGYGDIPRPTDRWGWEIGGRLGMVREAFSPSTNVTGFYGAALSVPIRLGRSKEPWQADSFLEPSFLLVPEIGVNHLLASDVSHPLELTGTLSLRFHLWSNVLP